MKSDKGCHVIEFSVLALFLLGANLLLITWVEADSTLVGMMIAFLWFVFLSFNFFYEKIRNRKSNGPFFKYFILLGGKFVVVLGGAFLILSPESGQIKQEALFYLFDYFIFLMMDVFLRAGGLNLDK